MTYQISTSNNFTQLQVQGTKGITGFEQHFEKWLGRILTSIYAGVFETKSDLRQLENQLMNQFIMTYFTFFFIIFVLFSWKE